MTIVHVSTNKYHPCFWMLIKRQAKSHRVYFIALELISDGRAEITGINEEQGVTFINLKAKKIIDLDYDSNLEEIFCKLFKDIRPAVVHIQFFSGLSMAPVLYAASSLGIKKIITLHDHGLLCVRGTMHDGVKKCSLSDFGGCGCSAVEEYAAKSGMGLGEYNSLRYARAVNIFKVSDAVICCCRHQKKIVKTMLKITRDDPKLMSLYYGVDLAPATGPAIRRGSIATFGYLGNLSLIKGAGVLGEALGILNKKRLGYKLLMCLLKRPLRRCDSYPLFKKISKNNNVAVLTNIKYSDLHRKFFAKIDYLIVPSVWEETGPMTIFESFSYGVPVITSDQESMKEKIGGNVNSFVFKDAAELARIMEAVISGKIKKAGNAVYKFKPLNVYEREIGSIYKSASDKYPRTLKLKIGYLCNNSCNFCVTGDNLPREFVSLPLLKHTLEKHRGSYERVIITGGEPSAREDFISILDAAFGLGYKIIIETNARNFKDKGLADRIARYNTDITAHLESYKESVQDSITGVKGSCRETVAGIANLRKVCQKLVVKIMVTKMNYDHILYTAKLISKFRPDIVWIVFLTPYGNSSLNFKLVVPSYRECFPHIKKAIAWLKENDFNVVLENFPYCFTYPDYTDLMMEKPVPDKRIMFGVHPGASPELEHEYYIYEERPEQKTKFKQCARCKLRASCEGVYKKYASEMGSEEFRPVR